MSWISVTVRLKYSPNRRLAETSIADRLYESSFDQVAETDFDCILVIHVVEATRWIQTSFVANRMIIIAKPPTQVCREIFRRRTSVTWWKLLSCGTSAALYTPRLILAGCSPRGNRSYPLVD